MPRLPLRLQAIGRLRERVKLLRNKAAAAEEWLPDSTEDPGVQVEVGYARGLRMAADEIESYLREDVCGY